MRVIVTGMTSKTLFRRAVLCGVSSMAIVALAGPVMAQTTSTASPAPAAKTDDSTVVVVTGIRG